MAAVAAGGAKAKSVGMNLLGKGRWSVLMGDADVQACRETGLSLKKGSGQLARISTLSQSSGTGFTL